MFYNHREGHKSCLSFPLPTHKVSYQEGKIRKIPKVHNLLLVKVPILCSKFLFYQIRTVESYASLFVHVSILFTPFISLPYKFYKKILLGDEGT